MINATPRWIFTFQNIFNDLKRAQFGQGLFPKPCSKKIEYHKIPIAKKKFICEFWDSLSHTCENVFES
jgi:hypothetical protein